MKNFHKRYIIGFISVLFFMSLTLTSCSKDASDQGALEEKVEEKIEEQISNTNDKSVVAAISDIYSFSIDGVDYQLPCRVSDFTKNGWSYDKEYEDLVIDEVGDDSLWVSKRVDDNYIQLLLGGYSTSKGTHIDDLYVGKVSVNEGQGIEIDLSGITIGSNHNDFKDKMEQQAQDVSYNEDTHGRIVVRYKFAGDKVALMDQTYEYMDFVLDPETENVFQIILSFYPVLE